MHLLILFVSALLRAFSLEGQLQTRRKHSLLQTTTVAMLHASCLPELATFCLVLVKWGRGYNLFGEGYFYDFLGDILETVGEVGELVLLDLAQLHVVGLGAFMRIFESVCLLLAKLQLHLHSLFLNLYLLSTHVRALDGRPAAPARSRTNQLHGKNGVFAGNDDAVALMLEGEPNACPTHRGRQLDIEFEMIGS